MILYLIGGENKENGKHKEENKVENSIFYYLAKEKKMGSKENPGKTFLSGPIIFVLPTRKVKIEDKVPNDVLEKKRKRKVKKIRG